MRINPNLGADTERTIAVQAGAVAQLLAAKQQAQQIKARARREAHRVQQQSIRNAIQNGLSKTEIAGILGISRARLYQLAEEHQE